MPLDTARHLSNRGRNSVNLIRVGQRAFEATVADTGNESPTGGASNASQLVVTDVTAPAEVAVDQSFAVGVTVQNLGASRAERRIDVVIGNRTRTRTVAVEGDGQTTTSVTVTLSSPGTYSLQVGDVERSVTVQSTETARIGDVPARGPPNATVRVPVVDAAGQPLANATVTAGDQSARTNQRGIARLQLPATPGEYRIRAMAPGKESASRAIRVERGTPRTPLATVTVTPSAPTVVTRPTVTVDLLNPWNRSLTTTIGVFRDDRAEPLRERGVELAPGDRATVDERLDRAAVGTHQVTVTADRTRIGGTEYAVQGDQRVVSAAATTGRYAPSTGLGRSIRSVFGNLELLLATLVGLVAMATVGTVTAAFASAVHARRHTIGVHRATGASPRQVLAIVLRDTLRLSLVATLPAVVVGYGSVQVLRLLGVTTVFGVSVVPPAPLAVMVGAAIAGVALAACGGVLATVPMIRRPPRALLE